MTQGHPVFNYCIKLKNVNVKSEKAAAIIKRKKRCRCKTHCLQMAQVLKCSSYCFLRPETFLHLPVQTAAITVVSWISE